MWELWKVMCLGNLFRWVTIPPLLWIMEPLLILQDPTEMSPPLGEPLAWRNTACAISSYWLVFFRWQYIQEGHGAITLHLSGERGTLPTSKAEFQTWLLLLSAVWIWAFISSFWIDDHPLWQHFVCVELDKLKCCDMETLMKSHLCTNWEQWDIPNLRHLPRIT